MDISEGEALVAPPARLAFKWGGIDFWNQVGDWMATIGTPMVVMRRSQPPDFPENTCKFSVFFTCRGWQSNYLRPEVEFYDDEDVLIERWEPPAGDFAVSCTDRDREQIWDIPIKPADFDAVARVRLHIKPAHWSGCTDASSSGENAEYDQTVGPS